MNFILGASGGQNLPTLHATCFAGVCDVSIPGGEDDFTDEKTGKANVGSLRDSCLLLDPRLREDDRVGRDFIIYLSWSEEIIEKIAR